MTAAVAAPPARRSARAASLTALAAAGGVLGVVTSVFKSADGTHPWWDTALSAASGFLFLFAGVLAARRRPDSRTGLLMVLTGVAIFAEDLQFAPAAGVHTIGLLMQGASTGVLAHLVLAFPSGVLAGGVARVVVAAAYGWSFLICPISVLFYGQASNLLALADVPAARDVTSALAVPIGLAVVVVLALRWRAGRPSLRQVLTPVLAVSLVGAVVSVAAAAVWSTDLGLYRPLVTAYQVTACLMPLAFLVGLLRIRLGRSGVARLVEALNGPVAASDLPGLLRRALGDPGLVVAYPRADGLGLVDADGRPVRADSGGSRVSTEVLHDGRPVAVLLHHPAVLDDEHVLRAVSAAAGLALVNERLKAELRAQLAEVRRSRTRIVAAQEAERDRLERDLHDGVQPALVASLISLRSRTATAPDPLLARAETALQRALEDLRRIAHGIRPALLVEAGLEPALHELLDGCGLEATLSVENAPAELHETLYFVVAEGVSNAMKHAAAHRLEVRIQRTAASVVVSVRDDGVGGAVLREHGGLQGLIDRVQAVGGTVRLESRLGRGTALRAEFGLPS